MAPDAMVGGGGDGSGGAGIEIEPPYPTVVAEYSKWASPAVRPMVLTFGFDDDFGEWPRERNWRHHHPRWLIW